MHIIPVYIHVELTDGDTEKVTHRTQKTSIGDNILLHDYHSCMVIDSRVLISVSFRHTAGGFPRKFLLMCLNVVPALLADTAVFS